MATWLAGIRLRPRRHPGAPGGMVAAYALVLGLTAAAALAAFGLGKASPQPAQEAAAPRTESAAEAPVRRAGSLKLPPRPAAFRALSPAEQAGLIEVTPDGQRLPAISPNGWMPWIAYARRYDPEGPAARIGLLMINLGADETLMERAIDELPAEVSLAFLPGTPDLPAWLQRARERGHESYLMLPLEDPSSPGQRGIRPIETAVDAAENVRRLRVAMARGEGYIGFVVPTPAPAMQADQIGRPLVKELADRGLALVEINPAPGAATLHRLTIELGVGYARSSNVLDYKPEGQGIEHNLDRLVDWVGESQSDRNARHDFGVLQPDAAAIAAIVAWRKRLGGRSAVSLVPLIGHFECRQACMARVSMQPMQLRP
jgi:polysaccharide deacetylase 2 family uncharacterized protein YibQ